MKIITWSKFANVISLVFIILGILTMLYSFFFMGFDVKAHKVPCYDKYSNVIQGQTCISNNFLSDDGQLLFIGIIILIIGIGSYAIDKHNDSMNDLFHTIKK